MPEFGTPSCVLRGQGAVGFIRLLQLCFEVVVWRSVTATFIRKCEEVHKHVRRIEPSSFQIKWPSVFALFISCIMWAVIVWLICKLV